MNNIRQYASPNMPAMLLVGNKIDLPNRVVSTEEGLAAARQYNVRFIETSAKTSMNTNGALETIARDAFFMSVNRTLSLLDYFCSSERIRYLMWMVMHEQPQ